MHPESRERQLAFTLHALVQPANDRYRYDLVLRAMNLANEAGFPTGFESTLEGATGYIVLPTGRISWPVSGQSLPKTENSHAESLIRHFVVSTIAPHRQP